jgi:hypothetical protein
MEIREKLEIENNEIAFTLFFGSKIARPIPPDSSTVTGSGSLKRQRRSELTMPIAAVGRSKTARLARMTTAPLRAPVAAAVAPSASLTILT